MKTKKYLEFYERCVNAGRLVSIDNSHSEPGGLCAALSTPNILDEFLDLFEPTAIDCKKYGVRTWWYWASDNPVSDAGEFNDTRKNIVLFLAAMNDEL